MTSKEGGIAKCQRYFISFMQSNYQRRQVKYFQSPINVVHECPLKKLWNTWKWPYVAFYYSSWKKNVAKLTFFRSNDHTNEIRYDVISNPYCNIFPSTLCDKWVISYLLQNPRVQTRSYFNLMQDKLPSLRIHAFKVKDFQHTWKNTIVKGGSEKQSWLYWLFTV